MQKLYGDLWRNESERRASFKNEIYTVDWGEYGIAGVKSAPFYLKNGMSWGKMLLHKVPFI